MKNKLLYGIMALLGFSGCSDNAYDTPNYYGPYPPEFGTKDIKLSTQIINEDSVPINNIRIVSGYTNKDNRIVTDTAYTKSTTIEGVAKNGIAVNTLKYASNSPSLSKGNYQLEVTDIDGNENGKYKSKIVEVSYLQTESIIVLTKEDKE